MKGLMQIPNSAQLLKAYNEILGEELHSIDKLCEYIQWIRFDPRLGEILVHFLFKKWKKINPIKFNKEILKQTWPALAGVVFETVRLLIPKSQKKLFDLWMKTTLLDVKAEPEQLLYVGIYKLGSSKALIEAQKGISLYRKWGFLSSELLINKETFFFSNQKAPTVYQKKSRQILLRNFIKDHQQFTVKDYLEYLEYKIHIRSAQKDLHNCPQLKSNGYTRNKMYYVVE